MYERPYYLFILLAALLVARRLKRHDFLSLPDVLGAFYGNPARIVGALASFFYSIPILAVMGLGVLLDVAFGVPFTWGVLAGAAFSLAYTVLGGLVADSLTDTVQFVLMCVTLGIAAWLGLERVGGVDALMAAVPESHVTVTGTYPTTILLVFTLGAASALVDPAFYQRIFAATSYRAVAVALTVGIGLWAAFDWVVTILGMVARASELPIAEPRYALLEITVAVLPAGLLGLFLVGVMATAMSTIDSYLLISGGNIAYDIWRPLRKRPTDDATLLRGTRLAMVGATGVTVALALFFRSVVSAWVFMATLLVSVTLVPVMAGLYLRAPHPRAAGTLSTAAGFVVALAFYVVVNAAGSYDPEWETVTLSWPVGERAFAVWQEHAILFALPASALGYAAGWLWGAVAGPESAPPGAAGSGGRR